MTIRIDQLNPTLNPERDHEFPAIRDGVSVKLRAEQVLALGEAGDPQALKDFSNVDPETARNAIGINAINTPYDDSVTDFGLDPADRNTQKAIEAVVNELRLSAGKEIGEVFYLWDHLNDVEPPDNSGDAKFIRLTAGQSGIGGYNEGLLSNESVSGSAPLVEATAEITTGPLQGETIHLINTEEAFLRARETSGELQMDQMQRLTGGSDTVPPWQSTSTTDWSNTRGIMTSTWTGSNTSQATSSGGARTYGVTYDSADSPNARASSTTSGETRSKNVSGTAYMRIA